MFYCCYSQPNCYFSFCRGSCGFSMKEEIWKSETLFKNNLLGQNSMIKQNSNCRCTTLILVLYSYNLKDIFFFLKNFFYHISLSIFLHKRVMEITPRSSLLYKWNPWVYLTCVNSCVRYPMAMGTLADLEDQEPINGKESPLNIHLKVSAAFQQP